MVAAGLRPFTFPSIFTNVSSFTKSVLLRRTRSAKATCSTALNAVASENREHGTYISLQSYLIFDALGLDIRQPVEDHLGVHDGDDTIEGILFRDGCSAVETKMRTVAAGWQRSIELTLIDEERLNHWGRVRESRGFDDHAIELVNALVQPLEGLDQVATDGTAVKDYL